MEPCFTSPNGFGGLLGSMELKNTYLPIYYDAWLYDHHDDPLMSRRYEKTCDSVSTYRMRHLQSVFAMKVARACFFRHLFQL